MRRCSYSIIFQTINFGNERIAEAIREKRLIKMSPVLSFRLILLFQRDVESFTRFILVLQAKKKKKVCLPNAHNALGWWGRFT